LRIPAALGVLAGALFTGLAMAASTPGVTPSSILVGGTAPLSGENAATAALASGADAYFRYVNARGGVHGRRIVYRYLDDGADPNRTANAVRQLVERDRAFALFNIVGTRNNLAVRDYLNARKVPQLFVASGYTAWGSDARRYPWTVGFGPTFTTEATAYGRYLASTKPGATIAVLYQDDEDGYDLLQGLKRGLGNSGAVVEAAGFDPRERRVDTHVAELRQTKATVFMIFCSAKFAAQALNAAGRARWRPQVFLNAAAAGTGRKAVGMISAAFAKDPSDPFWKRDPGMKLFRQVTAAAGLVSASQAENGRYIAGAAAAFTLVDTLQKAGLNLTRQDALKASALLNEANNPFLLPGIVVKTGPRDRFPIEQVQLQRWNGKRWVRFGGLVTAKS
jgi:branched-chain amino acid transport system substrate-binding protein